MSDFKRGLRKEAVLGLRRLANASGENWWKELLSRWTPSGQGKGLRLGVRANTLDFYANGNCVAHIAFGPCKKDHPGGVRAECHVKYVFKQKDAGQAKAVLIEDSDQWTWSGKRKKQSFAEIEASIAKFIIDLRRNGSPRRGKEKEGVDDIVGNNPTVIDLEMGLPAWRPGRGALRIDLVALEGNSDEIRLVFWEAKTFDDPRLRKKNGEAKVVGQLRDDYADYFKDETRERYVIEAYRECCKILEIFHDMRGIAKDLHPLVAAAASGDSNIIIDRKPRLIIFGFKPSQIADDNWKKHKAKLEGAGMVPLMEAEAKQITLSLASSSA